MFCNNRLKLVRSLTAVEKLRPRDLHAKEET